MRLFLRLARNGFWILTSRVGAQACMLVVTYLLAHRLGAAGFGQYSFMAAVLMLGNTLTTFGTDMYLIREIAAKDRFSEILSVLILQLLLSGLFIGFINLISMYLPHQTAESILALKIYSLALIPLAFFTVFTSVLRGKQRMGAYAALNVAIPLLLVIAVTSLPGDRSGIVTLACVLLGIQTAGTVLAGILCVPVFIRIRLDLHFSPGGVRMLIGSCLPMALIAMTGILYQKLNLTLLSILGSAAMLGMYSAAARILEAARMVHIAAYTALYPAMTEENLDGEARRAVRHSLGLLLVIAAMSLVLMFGLARPIIEFLFGSNFQPSIPVLKILSLSMIPYTANSYFSLAFLAKRREKIVLRVLTLSLFVLLMLNLLLIPSMGLIGAGWSVLAAEIFQAILFLVENRLHLPVTKPDAIIETGVLHELPNSSR